MTVTSVSAGAVQLDGDHRARRGAFQEDELASGELRGGTVVVGDGDGDHRRLAHLASACGPSGLLRVTVNVSSGSKMSSSLIVNTALTDAASASNRRSATVLSKSTPAPVPPAPAGGGAVGGRQHDPSTAPPKLPALDGDPH